MSNCCATGYTRRPQHTKRKSRTAGAQTVQSRSQPSSHSLRFDSQLLCHLVMSVAPHHGNPCTHPGPVTRQHNQAGSVQQDKRTRVCATQLTGGTFGAAPGSEYQPRCPPSLVLGHAGGAACQVRQSVASHEGHRVIQWPAVTRVVCQHYQRCPLAFEPHLPCVHVCVCSRVV